MKKFSIIMVVIMSICLVGFFAAFAIGGMDISRLYATSDNDFQEVTQDFSTATISSIKVQTNQRIVVKNHDQEDIKVVYFTGKTLSSSYAVKDGGVLEVQSTYRFNQKNLFRLMVQTDKTDYIAVYLPEGFDGKLELRTSSSRIEVDAVNQLTSLLAKNSSGKITVKGVKADDMAVINSSGSINLSGAVADTMHVENSSGSISFSNVSADTLHVQNSSGSIKGSGTFGKITSKNQSGRIELTLDCADITASNSSGRIVLNVKRADFNVSLKCSNGSVKVDGAKQGGSYSSVGEDGNIKATNSNGSIELNFTI